MPSSSDIRQQYLDFFTEKCGHTFVPSSPVVPHDDPTLMFANAGMNQFKDVFLGTGSREYNRAVNTQKCIRAGGKHNDLEDVGKDTYHHTFFEMLGNWSFGDYFKKEAIDWAWQLLVDEWGLDPERLHATYFEGDPSEDLAPDDEAREMWLQYLPASRVHPGNKKDNFWEMGATGPCGPCSELHYDRTPDKNGAKLVNGDSPVVIEIWNLVFIQFNRNSAGLLTPLPAKHIDTGMGFERICAVLQGKDSNYDTDVFTPLFDAIQKVTGARDYSGKLEDHVDIAYRVLADHIRCLTFALTDGATISNEGRGYVLRRILRRAVRHGWQTLETKEPFLHKLVPAVVDHMGEAFPELVKAKDRVAAAIKDEEEGFGRTLDRGIALFNDAAKRASNNTIAGDDAFTLHDTYGFPLDLTQVMAEEAGMTVDTAGFEAKMTEAQERSRQGGRNAASGQVLIDLAQNEKLPATKFVGYETIDASIDTTALFYSIAEDGYELLNVAHEGDHAALVVEESPFYGESGGQVGDTGNIFAADGSVFHVEDTQRVGESFLHFGIVKQGTFKSSRDDKQTLQFTVEADRRRAIMANHTGTHLMNLALRDALGDHVQQKGSLVNEQRLRFDFSHGQPMTGEQIEQVEKQVNEAVAANLPVNYEYAELEKARGINSLRAVFGEKYPPRVRVVSVGPSLDELLGNPDNAEWTQYSIEFCGGTHLKATGEADCFVITAEEGVAKGVRRLVALTGKAARDAQQRGEQLLKQINNLNTAGGADEQHLPDQIAELNAAINQEQLPATIKAKLRDGIAELQEALRAIEKQRAQQEAGQAVDFARQIAEEESGPLIVRSIDAAGGDALRSAMDVIRAKHPEAALLLAAAEDGKVAIVASVPKPLIEKGLKAGDWVRETAKVVGGGGGGRPDMAQAGGKDPSKLPDALEAARAFAQSKLG